MREDALFADYYFAAYDAYYGGGYVPLAWDIAFTTAHERAVFDDAALEVREVADRAVVADNRLKFTRAVDDRSVLHRRAFADHDAALVAAQHRLGPDGRLRPDHYIADDRRFGVHEGIGIDLGRHVAEGVERHGR